MRVLTAVLVGCLGLPLAAAAQVPVRTFGTAPRTGAATLNVRELR